ncbi:MAG: hypothetical protein GY913_33460 [Proteobacteria bacterium]|nr:hypothetical protein [Pseudomonadota bacterium]MCP4921835.1 hypothetical protein [Pseudomonadota bacterium]
MDDPPAQPFVEAAALNCTDVALARATIVVANGHATTSTEPPSGCVAGALTGATDIPSSEYRWNVDFDVDESPKLLAVIGTSGGDGTVQDVFADGDMAGLEAALACDGKRGSSETITYLEGQATQVEAMPPTEFAVCVSDALKAERKGTLNARVTLEVVGTH